MGMPKHVQQHPVQGMMRADDLDLCGKSLDVGSVSCVPSTRWIMPCCENWSNAGCATACCCD